MNNPGMATKKNFDLGYYNVAKVQSVSLFK